MERKGGWGHRKRGRKSRKKNACFPAPNSPRLRTHLAEQFGGNQVQLQLLSLHLPLLSRRHGEGERGDGQGEVERALLRRDLVEQGLVGGGVLQWRQGGGGVGGGDEEGNEAELRVCLALPEVAVYNGVGGVGSQEEGLGGLLWRLHGCQRACTGGMAREGQRTC